MVKELFPGAAPELLPRESKWMLPSGWGLDNHKVDFTIWVDLASATLAKAKGCWCCPSWVYVYPLPSGWLYWAEASLEAEEPQGGGTAHPSSIRE